MTLVKSLNARRLSLCSIEFCTLGRNLISLPRASGLAPHSVLLPFVRVSHIPSVKMIQIIESQLALITKQRLTAKSGHQT